MADLVSTCTPVPSSIPELIQSKFYLWQNKLNKFIFYRTGILFFQMTLFVRSLLWFCVSSKGYLISPYLWLNNIHAVYLKWNQFIEVVLRKLGNFENLIRTVYKTCSNSISWAWTSPSIIQTKRLLLVSNDAWIRYEIITLYQRLPNRNWRGAQLFKRCFK